MTTRYRKIPVEIAAEQWFPGLEVEGVIEPHPLSGTQFAPFVNTAEGPLTVSPGDWIITGVKGEKYPCKPDIFDMTYEPADQPGAMEKIKRIVDAQADDAALWAIPIDQRISEAYLQQELRKLHAAIEGDL
jgi:hypothetical protein